MYLSLNQINEGQDSPIHSNVFIYLQHKSGALVSAGPEESSISVNIVGP